MEVVQPPSDQSSGCQLAVDWIELNIDILAQFKNHFEPRKKHGNARISTSVFIREVQWQRTPATDVTGSLEDSLSA
jgi:hypothetical protein